MAESGMLDTEGARIAYDIVGTGPTLLMIPGGNGTGGIFAGVARRLSDQYRVITYDRRCVGRSTGDKSQMMSLDQQARDANALIDAFGDRGAWVFGSSGGGDITLAMLQMAESSVRGAIIHEPATFTALPDADERAAFIHAVGDTLRERGPDAAMAHFRSSLTGMEGHDYSEDEPEFDHAFFIEREFPVFGQTHHDYARIRELKAPLIFAAGDESGDVYYARTASVIAEKLDAPFRTISGNHVAYLADAATFAEELHGLLKELATI